MGLTIFFEHVFVNNIGPIDATTLKAKMKLALSGSKF
jgi:hypothetical protein